jgi:hypothetical protein
MVVVGSAPGLAAQQQWREATKAELAAVIPARAPVEHERIETESRTASGVATADGSKVIAGAVLITAGYSAEGKYSHFVVTQVAIKIAPGSAREFVLRPGDYVFGYKREENSLKISFYEAATGKPVGEAEATRASSTGAVRSFAITPPVHGEGTIAIGRFSVRYAVVR